MIREQSLFGHQSYAPTLDSGEVLSAAIVARVVAGSALAVRRRRLPNKPLPSAIVNVQL